MKNSETEKRHCLEREVASSENPLSGVVGSSTKCDSDANETLLPQKKKSLFYAKNNSVVAV
jgi:hypothetical protein